MTVNRNVQFQTQRLFDPLKREAVRTSTHIAVALGCVNRLAPRLTRSRRQAHAEHFIAELTRVTMTDCR